MLLGFRHSLGCITDTIALCVRGAELFRQDRGDMQ